MGYLHCLLRALAWETGIEIEIPVDRENIEILSDFHIIFQFEYEPGSEDFNYLEFCQYVDNSFLHSTVEQKKEFASEENACAKPGNYLQRKFFTWTRMTFINFIKFIQN